MTLTREHLYSRLPATELALIRAKHVAIRVFNGWLGESATLDELWAARDAYLKADQEHRAWKEAQP
jgi:hypothetical protein